MFSSLRDTTLRENNSNNNTSTLFPRPHFLQNNTNNSNNNNNNKRFHGKYLTRNITKKIKVRNNTNVSGGDENSSYQSNGGRFNENQQRTPKNKKYQKNNNLNILGNSSSKIVSSQKKKKKRKNKRRESFSFNTQKSEENQANYYEKQMKEESKKIAEKYNIMERGSAEKMKKYIAIKNNTMSPFKKNLLRRNGKATSYDIKAIENLVPEKKKTTTSNPTLPTFKSKKQNVDNKKNDTYVKISADKKQLFKQNLNSLLSTPRKKGGVVNRSNSNNNNNNITNDDDNNNVVQVKRIVVKDDTNDQDELSSSDDEEEEEEEEGQNNDSTSSISDVSSIEEEEDEEDIEQVEGRQVPVVVVRKSELEESISEVDEDSSGDDDGMDSNESEEEEDDNESFIEHDQNKSNNYMNMQSPVTPFHNNNRINDSMVTPASESDDLTSSISSSSVSSSARSESGSSTYSNSPVVTLGLFRRDDNGDLQHKVVVKNVKKNAAEKLQNWAKSCMIRKRFQHCIMATICLQKNIRRRLAYLRLLELKRRYKSAVTIQRFLSTKIKRIAYLIMKKAASTIIRYYRGYKSRKNVRLYLSAKVKMDEAREIARQAMENLEASRNSVTMTMSSISIEEEEDEEPKEVTIITKHANEVESKDEEEEEEDDDDEEGDSESSSDDDSSDIENDVTDIQEDELSEISEVEDEEATEISIDITVEHAVENVIKKIESKPTTSINVSFANAVNNVENRVERISLGDDITTVSINGFVNEDEGYTNYIVCIDDVFSKLRGLNSLSNYDLQHSPRKPLVIKKRYSEFFKFDKELIIHFDKNSYGIPSLPPKTWCRNMSEAFVTRRAVDLNNYIKVISKETDIRNSELYKNFIMMGEERK